MDDLNELHGLECDMCNHAHFMCVCVSVGKGLGVDCGGKDKVYIHVVRFSLTERPIGKSDYTRKPLSFIGDFL